MNKYSLAQVHAIYCVYRDLNPRTKTVNCCTCGKTIYITSFTDCYSVYGHFIDRSVEPKLKYHNLNAYPQCSNCNTNLMNTKEGKQKYLKYILYRYGRDISEELKQEEQKTEQYWLEFYKNRLLELISVFPELTDIVVDSNTGEVYDNNIISDNCIEQQFNTFSKQYKSDLDSLCRALKLDEYVEYNRL